MELTIDGPPGASGADLQAELTSRFGTGRVSVEGQYVSALRLGEPPLVSGSVLVDGGPGGSALRPGQGLSRPAASLALAVHSGAGAGTVVLLRRGTYTIGRSHGEIVIPDADLSRTHARLVVTETAISIVDLDSANGTEVDGQRVRNAVISTGSVIRCGNSTMSLVFLDRAGSLDDAGEAVLEPLVVVRSDDAANRVALLLTAVLPLAIGVGLAVITGMWMFLAFSAVSAVSVLVPLITSRRQRRGLAAAVRTAVASDQERRRRAAPPLSVLALRGVTVRNRTTTPATAKGIWLRLGQAVQPANLRFEPADPARSIPSAGMMPLTLDPGRPLTTIRGPQAYLEGLMRAVLMQVAGYPSARGTRVVIHGQTGRLPLAARYLDGCTLSSDDASLEAILERGFAPGHGILILLDDAGSSDAIILKARGRAWQVLHFFSATASPIPADLELAERTSVFHTGDGSIRFAPDLATPEVFNRFCRQLAQHAADPRKSGPAIPTSCRLEDLLPQSTAEISSAWQSSRTRAGLAVPVGRALDGIRLLDLQADGPHLLVAGTTGSGKSELLRSLTIALAVSHPPDRINFLFIDFKGGSGLGPLTGLPHCVGMLTDLTSHQLERSLKSLRAEIRFREEALAAVQAPDLTSYRTTPDAVDSPLPRLAIVIDEFRMLVEEAPEALSELMRIAAIGRSLGIHLVMATQRPQGALTADIRANVTTSIALRVQSEMESLDIINSKAAAGISVDTPGRAYLARGTAAPEEFQAGSLTAGSARRERSNVSVGLASDYINRPTGPAGSEAREATPHAASAPLVAATSALWKSLNGKAPRRPVAAPLPCLMPEPDGPDTHAGDGWAVRLGLMDLPSEQRTAPLVWEPEGHGHLGLVGGPNSGLPEAMRLAVLRLAFHRRESHLYVLDPDSSFGDLASHCRVGASAGLRELRRAVRILERLAQEQSRRLGRPGDGGDTPLVLAIAGWGSWVSAFRAGPLGWAEDLVQDLIRDGGRAGITVIVSGQRELVTSRFFAAVPNRVYFPTGSSEDSRLAWPKLPPTPSAAGRGVATGAISAGKPAVCQFYTAIRSEAQACGTARPREPAVRSRPFRIEPLPAVAPAAPLLQIATAAPVPGHRLFRIGVGGDELAPLSVRVPAGGVLAVLGAPASGKSSFLRLLPRLNPHAGPWLRQASEADPGVFWSSVLRRAAAGELDRRSVALVDDTDLLPQETNRDLADLNALGVTVVMTAGFGPVLSQRVPLAIHARSLGSGVLIGPRTLMDGDLFGVRFETEPNPPPGRGVLIRNGRPMAVQLGWQPPDGQPAEAAA